MNIPIPQHGGRVGAAVQSLINTLFTLLATLLGWQLDSVENIAGLATVDDTRIPDGSKKVVRSLWDSFTLDKTDTTSVVDGITVVATMSGDGRWLRDLQPTSTVWSNQATWYVDADNGSDENDGLTDSTELATFAEFRRRVEPGGVLVEMTVEIQTDLPADDPVELDTMGERVIIVGVPTVIYTGEVNTWTDANGPGNTPPILNDSGWTVASHIRQHVRFTSGAADTMGCWVLEDLTGNDARMSFVNPYTTGFGAGATPAGGDTFVVETFPSVTFGRVRYNGRVLVQRIQFTNWDNFGFGRFYVNDLSIIASQIAAIVYDLPAEFGDCIGSFIARNNILNLYSGAYGRFVVETGHVGIRGDDSQQVVFDSSIPQSTYITLGEATMASIYEPMWLYGANAYLDMFHDSYWGMFGDARLRGDNTAAGLLAILGREAQIFTDKTDHTVTSLNIRQVDSSWIDLNTKANFGGAFQRVQVLSQVYSESDLTASATTETLNLGAYPMPPGARIVGVDMHNYTPFTGGTLAGFTIDIGSAGDPDAIVDGADIFAAGVDGGVSSIPDGIRPNKLFAVETQLTAKFDSAGDDVDNATAGDVTVDVYYTVDPS